jgi:hypothetical protein
MEHLANVIAATPEAFNHLVQFAQAQTPPAITPPDISPLPKTSADPNRIKAVLQLIFGVLGAVAVLMIVIGGIKYSSSQGDPQGVSKAKGTVIYAIVGLVIAILATAIVDFVMGRATP